MYGSIGFVDDDSASPLLGRKEGEAPQTRIGWIGSFAIFVNALVGPGMATLPHLYRTAGYVTPTVTLVVGTVVGALATIVRCDTVALEPGNSEFELEVEFCDPVRRRLGETSYRVAHVLFYVTAVAQCIAGIGMTSVALDLVIAYTFGQSYALTVYRGGYEGSTTVWQSWSLAQCPMNEVCRPFYTGGEVKGSLFLTLGYVIVCALTLPLSVLPRIAEGMVLQYVAFWISVGAILIFIVHGLSLIPDRPGTINGLAAFHEEQSELPGLVIFNLMYGIFVSTWLTEKERGVQVRPIVATAAGTSGVLFVAFGLVIGMAYREVSSNALITLAMRSAPPLVTAASLSFGTLVIASGIPVASIMARRNLESIPQLEGSLYAVFAAGALPFTIAWLFYQPHMLTIMMNLVGLYAIAWIALILPFVLVLAIYDPLPEESGLGTYGRWLYGHLTAPPDENLPTVISPLPWGLQRHARSLYAATTVLLLFWLAAAVFVSISEAFKSMVGSSL